MTAYRLLSTRHHWDGSMEAPSTDMTIRAEDDGAVIEAAQHLPRGAVAEDADFAWILDEDGRFVRAFTAEAGRILPAASSRAA